MSFTISRWKQHLPALSWLIGGQSLLLLINAVSGLLLVWLLPKSAFALLAICNNMIASVNVICDPATGTGIQSIGGRVFHDQRATGSLMTSVLELRWKLLAVAGSLWTPLTIWLLLKNGASAGVTTLLCLACLTLLATSIEVSAYKALLLLNSKIQSIQKIELFIVSLRLVSTLLLVLAWPTTLAVLLVLIGSIFLQLHFYSRFSAPLMQPDVPSDLAFKKKLSRQFWQMLPFGLYNGVQGGIGLWLLGWSGASGAVADFGALLRMGVLFSLLGTIVQQIVIPRLARCQSTEQMRPIVISALALFISLYGLAIVACSYLPLTFLWVLGPQYHHLVNELPWMIGYLALNALSTILWWFNTARGETHLSWMIPLVSLSLVAGIMATHFPRTLMDSIALSMMVVLPSIIIGLVQGRIAMRKTDQLITPV